MFNTDIGVHKAMQRDYKLTEIATLSIQYNNDLLVYNHQRGNRRYQTSPALCNRTAHFAVDNRLVERLQLSVCPCRVLLHGPVQFAIIRGITLVGHMFPPKIAPSSPGIVTPT